MASCTRLPIAWRSPTSLAPLLAAEWGHDGLIWLDGDGTPLGRWATLAVDPLEQHCCRGLPGEQGARDPFAVLSQLGPGHWCGWLSYEVGGHS